MALTSERRGTLLAYCRIEESDLDDGQWLILDQMYDAAVDYMTNAGVAEPDAQTSPQRRAAYEQSVNALVLDDWDHRGGITAATLRDNPAFRRRVNQLRFSEPRNDNSVPDSGTLAGGVDNT